MSQDIFQQIEQLREQAEGNDSETLRILDSAKDTLKKSLVKQALSKNPAMAMFLEMLNRRLKGINGLLQEDESLNDVKRAELFGKKREIEAVFKFFSVADKNVELINKEIEKRFESNVV